jgi:DNA-binding CsgD family transcriptional regulator
MPGNAFWKILLVKDSESAIMETVSKRVSSGHIVGRTAELAVGAATIQQVLDNALDRSPSVLLISGEAGIGKTRLLDELLHHATAAGAITACGHCLEHGGEIRPLTAVADILDDLGPAAPTDHRPGQGMEPGAVAADPTTPAEAVARLFSRARSLLRELSARGAVVVAIEDLHWSDRSTRGLLTELVRARGLDRVLFIGTYRSDELHRRHPLIPFLADLEQTARPERIELAPLDENEMVELASAVLGPTVAESRGRHIAHRSGGNPFYAEELLAVDGDTDRLPTGVRHVVLARSQGLDADALRCLQMASTLAQPIDPVVLREAAGLEVPRFRSAIDALCRQRFLTEHHACYRFRHDLVREVFLAELLPGQRTELFARAAGALEAHQPERLGEIARLHAQAAQLPNALRASVQAAGAAASIGASAEASEHYGRAIDLWNRVDDACDQAGLARLQLLRRAAEVADLARDFDVAVQLAKQAAVEARELDDPFEEGAALFDLSGYLWNASGPGMEETIERAMTVLPREPVTVERARLELRSAMNSLFAGETAGADIALESVAAMAAQLGDRGIEVTARAHIGYLQALLGDDEALENLHDQLRLAWSLDDGPAGTVIAINLTHALLQLGRFSEVADLHEESVAFAERHGFGPTRGVILEGNVLQALEALGRWGQAETIMTDITRQLSAETVHRWASAFLGWTQIQINRGHHSEVVDSYRRGLELAETGYYDGDVFPIGTGLVELAAAGVVEPIALDTVEGWLQRSRPEDSLMAARLVATAARHLVPPAGSRDHERAVETVTAWIDRLERSADEFRIVPPVLMAWLDQARTELTEASASSAPDRWAGLVAVRDEHECRYFAAEARYRQADSLLRTGGGRSAADRAEATALLSEADRTAADLGAGPLRHRIEDLARRARLKLEGHDKSPIPSEPLPFGLTGRELEVLHLVNEGRSNGEIGAALFISTKTASVHVSNILRKLGAANRIEAAAIARRHQLFGG